MKKTWFAGILGLGAAGGGWWYWQKHHKDLKAASTGVRGTLPPGAVITAKSWWGLGPSATWRVDARAQLPDGSVTYSVSELQMVNGQPVPAGTGKKMTMSPLDISSIVSSPAALVAQDKTSGDEELVHKNLMHAHKIHENRGKRSRVRP